MCKQNGLFSLVLIGLIVLPLMGAGKGAEIPYSTVLKEKVLSVQKLERKEDHQPNAIIDLRDQLAQRDTNRWTRFNLWVRDRLYYLGKIGSVIFRVLEPAGYILFALFWVYVGYIMYMQTKSIFRSSRKRERNVHLEKVEPLLKESVSDLLRKAEEYGRQKKWRDASHYLFGAFSEVLRAVHPSFQREHTAREMIQMLPAEKLESHTRRKLKEVTPLYERIRYGGYNCQEDEWKRLYETVKRVVEVFH